MKKILVIYYTQSGQIKNILYSILSNFDSEKVKIDFAKIKPVKDYPFPWQPSSTFYNVFPESVKGISIPINALFVNNSENYDLVILGLQVWYLSPSVPISSFLKSEQAKIILNNKPVITVYGTRNMWVSANKTVKSLIKKTDGNLVGNIVLSDKHHNLISVITIIRWLINGKKEASKFFPEAGVSSKDFSDAQKFGKPIFNALNTGNYENLQNELVKKGAVQIEYHILKTELTGKRIFRIWADLILIKGKNNPKKRKRLIKLFSWYLIFVIYTVYPIASLIFKLKKLLFTEKVKNEIRINTSL